MDNPLENIQWSNVVFNVVRDYQHHQTVTTPFAMNFLDEFEIQDVLGRGVFGTTYRIMNRRTGALFALKVLNKPDPVQLQKEVEALVELSKAPYCRPHVLCYYSAFAITCLDPARRALENAATVRKTQTTVVSGGGSISQYPGARTAAAARQNNHAPLAAAANSSTWYQRSQPSTYYHGDSGDPNHNHHHQPPLNPAAAAPNRQSFSTVMNTHSSSYVTGNDYLGAHENTYHTSVNNHPTQHGYYQKQSHDPSCVDYVILTEYVPGRPLKDLIREATHAGRALTGCVGMYYLMNLLDAVISVHDAGFVHLDIKPDNLMVTPEGSMVLVDFGQACGGSMTCYTTGGDYKYQAPELRLKDWQQQALLMGFGQLEPWDERYEWVKMQSLQRADMYSVALTVLEMFTGMWTRAQVDAVLHASAPPSSTTTLTGYGEEEGNYSVSTPGIQTGMGDCIDQWIYHQLFSHPTQRQTAKESRQWLEYCLQSSNSYAACSQTQ